VRRWRRRWHRAYELRVQTPDSLVGGERDAVRIGGFDASASSQEFLHRQAAVRGDRSLIRA
jgi:phosphosulfolactate phosphohydrolase-like enzyme